MHPTAECSMKERGGDRNSGRQDSSPSSAQSMPLGQSLHLSELPLPHLGLGALESEQCPWTENLTVASPGGGVTVQGSPCQLSLHFLPRLTKNVEISLEIRATPLPFPRWDN